MNVLVFSKIQFLREMLIQALAAEPSIVVIDEPGCGLGDAPLPEVTPRLVVADARHPEVFAYVSDARLRFPAVAIVVLAMTDREEEFLGWADIGIAGYVEPDSSAGELVSVVCRVAAGDVVCPPRLTAVLLKRQAILSNARPTVGGIYELTHREREVLEQLAEGLCNKRIARKLHIAESTVKNHVHSILEKWDLRTRGEAAARYRQSSQERAGAVRKYGFDPFAFSGTAAMPRGAGPNAAGLAR